MATLRRHRTAVTILLLCTASLLYSYGSRSSFEGSARVYHSEERAGSQELADDIAASKQSRQEFRKFSNVKRIPWEATERQRKTTTHYHHATRSPFTQRTQLTRKKSKVRNVWSESWPKVNIGNCSHMEYINRGRNSKYQVEAQHYPTTGLISFPGSGNSWIRHLIQQATGLWTGSVFHDRRLFEGGLRAELDDCNDKGSVVIKGHYPDQGAQVNCTFDRAIIVMRDPYRAVLSEFNWRKTRKHTGVAEPRLYQSSAWKQHVIRRTATWHSTTRIWIEKFYTKTSDRSNDEENPFLRDPTSSRTLLMVSYELMRKNPTKEMERIVKFLQLKTFRRNCLQANQEGNFRRTSSKSESIDCLFRKFDLQATVEKEIRILAARTVEIGLGDVTSAFEGPGGDVVSEICRYV